RWNAEWLGDGEADGHGERKRIEDRAHVFPEHAHCRRVGRRGVGRFSHRAHAFLAAAQTISAPGPSWRPGFRSGLLRGQLRRNHDKTESHGVIVRQRNVNARNAPLGRHFCKPFGRTPRQMHTWLTVLKVDHTHIAPEHAVVKPSPKRLRAGLFCGEALGVTCRALPGMALGAVAFRIGIDAADKTLAKALKRLLDAADIDKV